MASDFNRAVWLATYSTVLSEILKRHDQLTAEKAVETCMAAASVATTVYEQLDDAVSEFEKVQS